jgi:hypothetical protein
MENSVEYGSPAKLRVSLSDTINPDVFSPFEVKRLPPIYGPEDHVTLMISAAYVFDRPPMV